MALAIAGTELDGDLTLPGQPVGVVLFAHGSGSTRRSPRNRMVAEALQTRGLGTLLVDLLTPEEELRDAIDRELRFDIGFLADRLIGLTDWLTGHDETARLPIGLFGASTGAAAALVCAASRPDHVRAVVSRGGRPDLAGPALGQVEAPTLMLVGGEDQAVLRLNEQARSVMTTTVELSVVPGATHLFEEPGTLDTVAEEAGTWFTTHL
ncbi:dienelactone hydrolase family protein [Paractinoplanes hotanensis]|uniref:Dienelactone hydrolase family protein n=1 Tax=Paractinoplanes hotanensis TaxID=2906497 RepID=A0ABT0Y7M6_9ACTN|nr:dienelactone hydrolase family protein [Actinoplanes hotanensis]MCM4082045.1 dienelactone hydrolase family protein [Actinoplanes hotanensis]